LNWQTVGSNELGLAGVKSQATATEYHGGDNIFINLPAKSTPDADPVSILLGDALPQTHMPGEAAACLVTDPLAGFPLQVRD